MTVNGLSLGLIAREGAARKVSPEAIRSMLYARAEPGVNRLKEKLRVPFWNEPSNAIANFGVAFVSREELVENAGYFLAAGSFSLK